MRKRERDTAPKPRPGAGSRGRSKIVPIESLRRRDEAGRAGEAPAVPPPTAEPSRERLLEQWKAALADLPEVRREKVIDAKIRISTGYYESDEVRLQILESMLGAMRLEGESGSAGARPEKHPKPTDRGPGSPEHADPDSDPPERGGSEPEDPGSGS